MDKNNAFQQLQMIEQNMQALMNQKQQFAMQQAELEVAIAELEKKPAHSYKILGNIMVSSSTDELLKEMQSKKDIVALRLQTLEKQENKLKEKAQSIQDEVMKELGQGKDNHEGHDHDGHNHDGHSHDSHNH